MTDRETNEATLEELRSQALKHYTEASNAIHYWSSFVGDAIKNYTPPKFRGTDRERAKDWLKNKHPELGIEWKDQGLIFENFIIELLTQFYREFRQEGLREEQRFNNFLREEFLLNTENYPKEYHELFQDKYRRAQMRFDEYLKTKE